MLIWICSQPNERSEGSIVESVPFCKSGGSGVVGGGIRIWVESEWSKGRVVAVSVPLSPGKEDAKLMSGINNEGDVSCLNAVGLCDGTLKRVTCWIAGLDVSVVDVVVADLVVLKFVLGFSVSPTWS